MASGKISLGGIVKEIDLAARALGNLRKGASPTHVKLLNAKIKKLGALKSHVEILCRHTLNANPLPPSSKRSKK